MKSWYNRKAMVVLGLIAVLILGSLVSGCSKKPEVETDADAANRAATETVPPPPVVEPTEPVVQAPDYATMDPSEYGIERRVLRLRRVHPLDRGHGHAYPQRADPARGGVTVLVSGHCDERGTVEYNLALGEKRAKAVRDYLVSLGVAAGSLRVTSYGESRPFATGHTEAAWAQNRRAHFERP